MHLTNITLIAVCSALTVSTWLICAFLASRHLQYFSQRSIQVLIIYIITLPPLYSLASVLSIVFPSAGIYLSILMDCYLSFSLYGFCLLMLYLLGCEEDDFKLVAYLETKTSFHLGFPLNVLCSKDLARGKAFLLYCRSSILQLCILKPLITVISVILNEFHVYNEFSTSPTDGYLYLLILLNISVIVAFAALAAFYTVFKMKLKPFHASKMFNWLVCVIFLTFWQGVIVTGIVQGGLVSDLGRESTPLVATRIQDLLVCIEMLLASIFSLWIFSYEPYTSGYVNPYDYSDYDDEVDVYERSGRPGAVGANYRYSMLNNGGELEEGNGNRSSNRSYSSRKPVTSSISGGRATLEFTDPSKMGATMDRGAGGRDNSGISEASGGNESGDSGRAKTAKKFRSLRGPSDMLRRFSNTSSANAAASIVAANAKAEEKVDLLPNTGGPTEYSTARSTSRDSTKKSEIGLTATASGAKKTKAPSESKSFVIEGEEEDEVDGMNQPPAYHQNVTDELPEDVMLLLGAKKSSRGGGAVVARDLNDFGHDGEVAPGSTVLRSIQSKYADTEYEVDVSRSSLGSATSNNDISQLVVGNPLLLQGGETGGNKEGEEAAVSSWSGKTMKERTASMEQRLVDSGAGGDGSDVSDITTTTDAGGSGPKVNVIKKTVTVTKKTKKHHHHQQSQK